MLEKLSDGEFQVKYLAKYQHREELLECCELAVDELGGELYEGRASCARVMGRAMELLRERYGLDAPRGWVPVMRILRETHNSTPRPTQTVGAPRKKHELSPAVAVWESEELSDLLARLYGLRDKGFSGRLRQDIANLLQTYTADEIFAAWEEFTEPLDDFELRFAPEQFCNGKGIEMILAVRQRTRERKEQQKTIEAAERREQEMAAAERVARSAAEGEVEDHLEDWEK
jgi:hypothetical protein